MCINGFTICIFIFFLNNQIYPLPVVPMIHQLNTILYTFCSMYDGMDLMVAHCFDFLQWFIDNILHQNLVVVMIDSMNWFVGWINVDQYFQCRHLRLFNRFLALDVIFISLLSTEVVLAWSDKKKLKTEPNTCQTQGRRQH